MITIMAHQTHGKVVEIKGDLSVVGGETFADITLEAQGSHILHMFFDNPEDLLALGSKAVALGHKLQEGRDKKK